jgi:hypothetical protein
MTNLKTGASALLCGLLLAGTAWAQTSTNKSPPAAPPSAAMKMTQAECDAAWNKLDTGHTGSVTQTQAQPSVSDFKKADINGDGKLSRTEFQQACDTGLVKSSASTGAGAGTSNSTSPSKK